MPYKNYKKGFVKKGHILVAQPFMIDPHFRRAVILLCDHSRDEGTIGFVLNRVFASKINDLIEDFPDFDADVYYGGPVGNDNIFYIHNVGDLLEESIEVVPGIWWGGNFDKLKFLISSKLIKPTNIHFFVGYAGWSPGQLALELNTGSWVISEMHPNYAFKSKPKFLWKQVLNNKGRTYTVIAQIPDTFNLN